MNKDRQASSLEVRPLRPAAERYDVAILGGGLAGLTLAIQLKRQRPDTERRGAREARGAGAGGGLQGRRVDRPGRARTTSREVVGMKEHLEERAPAQVRAALLPPGRRQRDITQRFEFGPTAFPPHANYQIDRGRFENELAALPRRSASTCCRAAAWQDVDSATTATRSASRSWATSTSLTARWVVDAAGRASLLKRKLGLAKEVEHTINSAWFRLAGGLDLEEWGRRRRRVDGADGPSRASASSAPTT